MKSCSILAGAITAGIASSAHAAFTGWTVESRGNIGGVEVYQVFANFDAPTDIVLNCLKHRVLAGSMSEVIHNDPLTAAGGSWNSAVTALPDQVANDSFVTMTGATGASAGTSLDPNFGSGIGSSIPTGGGWFTTNVLPSGSVGHVVGPTLRVMVMQVALAPGATGYTAYLEIGYKLTAPPGTPLFGVGSFTIPAPGVATLLLAAGTLGRRRRAQ